MHQMNVGNIRVIEEEVIPLEVVVMALMEHPEVVVELQVPVLAQVALMALTMAVMEEVLVEAMEVQALALVKTSVVQLQHSTAFSV